jgi:hypothetical protein
MRCIAYISLESRRLDRSDILDILRVSRERNAASGITGVLMYYDGVFLQIIEGDDDNVDALLERLRRDRRHRDLRVMLDESCAVRHFPDWAMALLDLPSLPPDDRWLCRHLDRPLPELQSDVLADRIRRLISSFQVMVAREGAPSRA